MKKNTFFLTALVAVGILFSGCIENDLNTHTADFYAYNFTDAAASFDVEYKDSKGVLRFIVRMKNVAVSEKQELKKPTATKSWVHGKYESGLIYDKDNYYSAAITVSDSSGTKIALNNYSQPKSQLSGIRNGQSVNFVLVKTFLNPVMTKDDYNSVCAAITDEGAKTAFQKVYEDSSYGDSVSSSKMVMNENLYYSSAALKKYNDILDAEEAIKNHYSGSLVNTADSYYMLFGSD